MPGTAAVVQPQDKPELGHAEEYTDCTEDRAAENTMQQRGSCHDLGGSLLRSRQPSLSASYSPACTQAGILACTMYITNHTPWKPQQHLFQAEHTCMQESAYSRGTRKWPCLEVWSLLSTHL